MDKVIATGTGCLKLNEQWNAFVTSGQIPQQTPSNIDMGILLRRRLILMQLFRILSCIEHQPQINILVLGVGRDDQFVRLARNPKLKFTCVDMPEVIDIVSKREEASAVKWIALNIVENVEEVKKLVGQNDIVIAEGLFIYLPVQVIDTILQAVEEGGKLILFNMETIPLKQYLPIMVSGFEEISRGNLKKLAEVPVTTWIAASGHGKGSPGVEVWVCAWCSSKSYSTFYVE